MGLFPRDRDLTRGVDELELVVEASALRMKAALVHVRLDHFLGQHLSWRSRTSIQELIREGYVRVDAAQPDSPRGTGTAHQERRPGRRLRHGSRVVVVIPEALRTLDTAAATGPIEVLYEDDEVLCVDKPAPLTVHPGGRHLSDTLIQRVHAAYRDEIEAHALAPRLCHRLDRETSGVVLVGKRPRSHREVMKQFEAREVFKEYLAVVSGEPTAERGEIELPLGPSRVSAVGLKMDALADGLPSHTSWELLERVGDRALVSCKPHTGRQHQIRVHLSAVGMPLVGDKLYGLDEALFQRGVEGTLDAWDLERLELPRHALHNHRLGFHTPAGGGWVEVTSPLARDLAEYLERRRSVAQPARDLP